MLKYKDQYDLLKNIIMLINLVMISVWFKILFCEKQSPPAHQKCSFFIRQLLEIKTRCSRIFVVGWLGGY